MNKLSSLQKIVFMLLLLVTNFGYVLKTSAQSNNLLAQIDVYRAIVNGEDVGRMSIDNNHCFQFYMQGGVLMFANNYTKLDSKSYGKITNVSCRKSKEKDLSLSDLYHFVWDWRNSFDDETGSADVYVKVVTTNEGSAVRIAIIDRNLEDVLDYGGVLIRGSLNSIR